MMHVRYLTIIKFIGSLQFIYYCLNLQNRDLYIINLQVTFSMFKSKQSEEKKVKKATVISEQILMKAVKDYLNENKIIPKESINFSKIKVLSLSFLNISKIQYLDSLVRLQKLQLDNNVIEKIQNLGHLVNLKWLDLSFNDIRKIEGLDNLVNLTDLSLYNNKITTLDGLISCSKLNIFSIGNNQIKTFEQVIAYFGKVGDKKTLFKYLQVLNVYGNPFTIKQGQKDVEYQYHLVANLPNLRYLDYIFIDEKRRKDIREFDEKFKTEDQKTFEKQLRQQEQKQRLELEEKKKKEKAKMNLLDGFAEDLVKIDDLEKIQGMEGLEQEMSKFISKIKQLIEVLQKRIKQQNHVKLQRIQQLEVRLHKREDESQKRSLNAIQQFEAEYKNSRKIIQNRERNWKQEAKKVQNNINKLREKLLSIQVELMEDSENPFKKQLLQTFEDENRKLAAILSEEQKDEKGEEIGYFKKMQIQIRQFGAKLDKISKDEVDRYTQLQASGGDLLDQHYGDSDLVNILANKDSIPNFISSIKQLLNEKRGKKQSEIENELCGKQKQMYKKQFEERQYQRNRNNIRNIKKKIEQLKVELSELTEEKEED